MAEPTKYHNIDGVVKPVFQIGTRNSKIYQSETEPSSPQPFDIWIRPSTRQIQFRNDINTLWLNTNVLDQAAQDFIDQRIADAGFATEQFVLDQISNIPVPTSTISNFDYFDEFSLLTVTATVWQTKVTYTFNAPEAGQYFIGYRFGYNTDNRSRLGQWRMLLDGTDVIFTIEEVRSRAQAGNWNNTGTGERRQACDFIAVNLAAGTHTVEAQLQTSNNNDRASMWGNSFYSWRIN